MVKQVWLHVFRVLCAQVKDWSNDMASQPAGASHNSFYYVGIYGAISGGQTVAQLANLLIIAVTSVCVAGIHPSSMLCMYAYGVVYS